MLLFLLSLNPQWSYVLKELYKGLESCFHTCQFYRPMMLFVTKVLIFQTSMSTEELLNWWQHATFKRRSHNSTVLKYSGIISEMNCTRRLCWHTDSWLKKHLKVLNQLYHYIYGSNSAASSLKSCHSTREERRRSTTNKLGTDTQIKAR